jgi:hypothetical protein
MNRILIASTLLLCFATSLHAQAPAEGEQPSLAEVARQNREQKKAKSKIVITDETIAASKGPIPEIKENGTDNSKEIVAAVARFKSTHTAQETEAALHSWYDGEDSQLAYEYGQSQQNWDGSWTRYYGSQDRPPATYQQMQERQLTQARANDVDRRSQAVSTDMRVNLQSRLGKVREGVCALGLNYEWFKIRCSAADCSY